MSIGWIRINTGHPRDWRSEELRVELGDPLADVYPMRLWCWAGDNAPTGTIPGKNPDRLVESAVNWQGEQGKLTAALVACGFLERQDGALVIAGWEETNGAPLRKAKADRQRIAAAREAARQAKKPTEPPPNGGNGREIVAKESQDSSATVARQSENSRGNVTRRNVTTTKSPSETAAAGSPPPTAQKQEAAPSHDKPPELPRLSLVEPEPAKPEKGKKPRTGLRAEALEVYENHLRVLQVPKTRVVVFTGDREDAVLARLADQTPDGRPAYSKEDLKLASAGAAKSAWHRESPGRQDLAFIFADPRRVDELIAIAKGQQPAARPSPQPYGRNQPAAPALRKFNPATDGDLYGDRNEVKHG